MKKNTGLKVLFLLYILVLIKVIVFKYPTDMLIEIARNWSKDVVWEGAASANYTLFKTIKLYARHWDNLGMISFGNLVGNVVAFIPLGYFLPRLFESMRNFFACMLSGLLFIFCIELFQLLSNFGVFDVDDILLNGVGTLMGYLLFLLDYKRIKSIEK